MKKLILTLAVVASVLTACKGEKKEKTEVKAAKEVTVEVSTSNVDTEASVLDWKGTKPTGAHNGIVHFKSGGIKLEGDKLVGGEFVIDMSTITNKDMEGSEGAGKLEGHLKSPDFFDIETYPTSKFVITEVTEADGKLNVTGNLTIKDVTKSITIPATLNTEAGVTTLKSETFSIDRADFNVKYGSKKFFDNLKDKFIDDIMELSFEVKTKA
jgi:polyisoprenoid-binding protein YceI